MEASMKTKRIIATALSVLMLLASFCLTSSAMGYAKFSIEDICSHEELEMLRLINSARTEKGLTPLTVTHALQMGSEIRATEMSDSGVLTQYRPDGEPWTKIFDKMGMNYLNMPFEARVSGSNSAAAVFSALMNKKDAATGEFIYRDRILDKYSSHIGIGLANSGKLSNVWSIIFTDCESYTSAEFTSPTGEIPHAKSGRPAEEWDIVICANCQHGKSYTPLYSSMLTKYDSELIGNQQITARIGSIAFTGTVYNDFADVANPSWYYDAVKTAFDSSLFSGTGKGNFSPSTSMTRAMFVVVLSKLAGVDTSTYGPSGFTDVPGGSWYEKPVTWASQCGIVGGTGTAVFSPNSPISREQICVMLKAYVDKMGVSCTSVNPQRQFEDDSRISAWAKSAVYFCQKCGFVAGDTNNNFNPKSAATRAQVAVIAVNFKNSIAK